MISFSVHGAVTVQAVCGSCSVAIKSTFKVDKHMLTTGNYSQAVATHLEHHERNVRAQMQAALWNEDKCGRCRIDAAERSRAVPQVSHSRGAK